MAFKRTLQPGSIPSHERLTGDMVGIGMMLAARANPEPNIEDTLLFASLAGMEQHDFRVLSILCTWLDIHSRWINADRLVEIAFAASPRVRLFWAAFGNWKRKDRRFSRLAALHKGPRKDLLTEGQDFQIRRFGEDPRFEGGPLRVDAKLLRDRPLDVLTPSELASAHSSYRWRIIIGPSYRADLWAELERNPLLPVTEVARRSYASIGAAWEASRDHKQLGRASVLATT